MNQDQAFGVIINALIQRASEVRVSIIGDIELVFGASSVSLRSVAQTIKNALN
ncbi:MAG TPA: hypothetical protein VF173_06880 [Thermoanaerobaculia bacterium]|nr:hypothetical protein [Thermoanaerobaculia bacterium]